MDTKIFEEIDFTRAQTKIYLTLLKIKESKANKIIKKSGLQSSSVYNSLNALINKGFVTYITKNKTKYYKAQDPILIKQYIDQKSTEFEKIIPELNSLHEEEQESLFELYQSYKGIKSMLLKIINKAKTGDEYLTFASTDPEEFKTAGKKVFSFIKPSQIKKKLKIKRNKSKIDFCIFSNF